MRTSRAMPLRPPLPRLTPPDRRPLVVVLVCIGLVGILLLIHTWSTLTMPRRAPGTARVSSPCLPSPTRQRLPVDLPFATNVVTSQIRIDPSGTIMVACSSATLAHVMADVQHRWKVLGWQSVPNLPQDGGTSLAFVRDGVVVFVTITSLPTTPPTQRIIITILQS